MSDRKISIDEITRSYKNLIQHLKANPTQPRLEDLRLINSTLLLLHAISSLILPALVRIFVAGFSSAGLVGSNYSCQRLLDEQIRFTGVFSLGFVLFNYLSNRWNADAQRDVIRVMTIVYVIGTFVSLVALYSGGSILLLLVAAVMGGLGFFHARESGLISSFAKPTAAQ